MKRVFLYDKPRLSKCLFGTGGVVLRLLCFGMVRRKKDYLCIATALADMTKNTMPLADNTTLFTVYELRSFYDGAGMIPF